MILSSIEITLAGALAGCSLDFAPGMNVVLGRNEAGKSTVMRGIYHLLLTPTRLPKRQFDALLSPLLPRPDGTHIEGALGFQSDGLYRVEKRWGQDAFSLLHLPDGGQLRGDEQVAARIGASLPVRQGTFSALFVAGQTQMDQTLQILASQPDARDEAAAVLRRARYETGGVSVEAFRRALEQRVESMFGRWDRERDRPEGGRELEDRWARGVGLLLEAYYQMRQQERDLAESRRAEDELAAADQALAEAREELDRVSGFLDGHRAAFREFSNVRGLDHEIRAKEERLTRLREDMRRWAVLVSEAAGFDEEAAPLAESASALKKDIDGAEEAAGRAERLRRYRAAAAAQESVRAAEEALQAIPAVDDGQIVRLQSLERDIAQTDARLSVGRLRGILTAAGELAVTLQRDGEDPTEATVIPGSITEIDAHRRIVVRHGDLAMAVEAGGDGENDTFDGLTARKTALETERDEICSALGVSSAADARGVQARREAADQRVTSARDALASALNGAEFDALVKEFGKGVADAEEAEPKADLRELHRRYTDVREQLAVLENRKAHHASEIQRLSTLYGSQDDLENELGETRRSLAELAERRSNLGSLPEPFESVEEFLAAYEQGERELPALQRQTLEARERQSDLRSRLPEQTSEELQSALTEAQRQFDRLKRQADALSRVEARVRDTLASMDGETFTPFSEAVQRYLSMISDDGYHADVGAEMLPGDFRKGQGPELPYDLLSQGTRDMLALAFRLALAEVTLDGAVAPLLMDDPLVDMDPDRRSQAASVLSGFAADRQVILFTCHPDHATLFPGAHRITLND